MAAPTVPKSKANANLNSIVSKEKSKRSMHKHVLCPEIVSWPRPSKSTEESILAKLSQVLKALPNIFHSNKKMETDQDKAEKQRIRSQLQIGTSSVLRALERDDLQCVLVSGKATPAITVDHVISLGKTKGCPILCLDGLSPVLALALDSKSLPLSIGFRQLGEGVKSDFSEVIALVKEHTSSGTEGNISNSWTTPSDSSLLLSSVEDKTPPKSTKFCTQQRAVRIKTSDEVEVLAEIKRVFLSAINKPPHLGTDTKKKKKKQKAKKNVKEAFDKDLHFQFEAGKRTVLGAIERGRLELVLISQEVEEVVNLSPLFHEKSLKFPPVIVLPGLTSMLRGLTSGACSMSFLGIKKLKLLPADSKQDFQKVLDMCHQSFKNPLKPKPKSESKITASETSNAETSGQDLNMNGRKGDKERKETHMENDEEGEEEEEEEEDYSYFYTMKEDSKDLVAWRAELKADSERIKRDTSFSVDFISFSASATDKGKKSSPVHSKLQSKMVSNLRLNVVTQKNPSTLSSAIQTTKPDNSGAEETKMTSQHIKSEGSFDAAEKLPAVGLDPPEAKGRAQAKTKQTTDTPMDFISLSSSIEQPEHQTKLSAENNTKITVGSAGISKTAENNKEVDEGNLAGEPSSAKSREPQDSSTCQPSGASLFSLDRKGDDAKLFSKPSQTSRVSNIEEERKSSKQDDILGAGDLKPCKGREGLDVLALDVSARSKNKTKALKRKLDREEGFISFKYTEANIKTMLANPSKKKKKKKNK